MSPIRAPEDIESDLEALLQHAAAEIASTSGAARVTILLVSDTISQLQPPVSVQHGALASLDTSELMADNEMARQAMAEGRQLYERRAYAAKKPGSRVELWQYCIPLQAHGQAIGAVTAWDSGPALWEQDQQDDLARLAQQLAVRVENRRLQHDQKRRIEQLQIVNEIGHDVAAILDIDQLLDRVVSLLQHRFQYYDASILLVDETSSALVWRAGMLLSASRSSNSVRIPMEEGIVGWVARHGKALTVNDVSADQRYVSIPELPDTRSELAVPIMLGPQALGVLDVQSDQRNAFDEDDVHVLQTLANQVAIALGNARQLALSEQRVQEMTALRDELDSRVSQLATIARIGQVVSSTLNANEIMATILELVTETLGVEGGVIFIMEHGVPHIKGSIGFPKEWAQWHEKGAAGWVLNTGQPLLLSGQALHDRFGTSASILRGVDAVSLLCAPMKTKGQVVGGIEVINRHDGHAFDGRDLEMLTAIMNSAATAIENAQLYAAMEARLAESTALCSMASHTTSSLSLEQVLNAIVQQLREVISCRAISVFLINEATQELRIAAASGIQPQFRESARIRVGEGVSGLVFKEVRPINLRDVNVEQPNLGLDPRVNSLLVVPLVAKSKVIGTLSVDSTEKGAFTADHERLLTIVAAQAASSIENARLFEAETERAEELARAYAELKELDRLKSQFVQNISHELRTPLTFVKGYADLLGDGAMGTLTSRQQQCIEIVTRKTEAIIELVNGIITLQELEAVPTHKDLTSLSSALHMVIDTAKATALNAGIELKNSVPDDKLWVNGDEDRLIQVFDNLIGNALKFSPNGGVITVSVADLPDHWQVAVQDQGIGIPEDKLEKIFERFYQVDGSTTRRFGGTGLGLAIAKEIVQNHDGEIWAESVLGQGSTFYVKLPKYVEQEDAKRQMESASRAAPR